MKSFWDSHPCGSQGSYIEAYNQRYDNEPWILYELKKIPSNLQNYLEVGCGQGIDSLVLCKVLNPNSKLVSIDYSNDSIAKAKENLRYASIDSKFSVLPDFVSMSALQLNFQNDTFDFVYSMGCLHHTGDTFKSITEIYRVLKPGGKCKIFLYRTFAIKVLSAHILRFMQKIVSLFTKSKKPIYDLILNDYKSFQKLSLKKGTMYAECFGVPVLESYTKLELKRYFNKFSKVEIIPYGYNFPPKDKNPTNASNLFGNFFLINAVK